MDADKFLKKRVLLVGGRKHAMATLKSVLDIAGVTNVVQIDDARRALDILCSEHFDAVYCHEAAQRLGGQTFPRAVRANAKALNPLIPVFELHDAARRGDVERARDLGVTDILISPISPKTVFAKLEAALERPRPFISAPNFFGPDRRTRRDQFGGKERRVRKPRKVAINQRGDTTPI